MTYSIPAICFHWVTVLLITVLVGLGWYMAPLPLSIEKINLYAWHKWIGVVVFAVTFVRLAWRFIRPAPVLQQPRHIQAIAHAVHSFLYLLLFTMPVLGWTMSSASGFPVVVFGVLPLPDLVAPNEQLAETLKAAHLWCGRVLLVLIALHVTGALWHHFVKRDGVLGRMLPHQFVRSSAAMVLVVCITLLPEGSYAGPRDPWQIDHKKSELTFAAKVLGAPMRGRFQKWTGTIIFDPAAPTEGSVQIDIDMNSVDAANKDARKQIKTKDWLAVMQFPAARFMGSGFTPDGEYHYRLAGTLSLRGAAVPLTLPVRITIDKTANGQLRAISDGKVTLERLGFGIGQGQWSATTTVANEVEITFKLHATRPN